MLMAFTDDIYNTYHIDLINIHKNILKNIQNNTNNIDNTDNISIMSDISDISDLSSDIITLDEVENN